MSASSETVVLDTFQKLYYIAIIIPTIGSNRHSNPLLSTGWSDREAIIACPFPLPRHFALALISGGCANLRQNLHKAPLQSVLK